MELEEGCSDLERPNTSPSTQSRSQNFTTSYKNKRRSNHVSLCGVDMAATSTVFHQLYTVGISSVARPPTKISHPHSFRTEEDPTYSPDAFHGTNGSKKSLDVVTRLFTAGVDFIMESQNRLCLPQELDTKKGDLLETRRRQGGHELRVLEIAEDLKWEVPGVIKRENLIPMVKQRENEIREIRVRRRNGCKSEQKGTANRFNTKTRVVPLKIEDVSDSEDYPSDLDEFLDFAKMIVQEQNDCFESPSLREVDTLMRETIQSHHLSEDDDIDNTTSSSSSSFSGHKADVRNLKRHVPIEEDSFRRVVGSIVHKKENRKAYRTTTAKRMAVLEKREKAEFNEFTDPIITLTISGDEEINDGESSGIERGITLPLTKPKSVNERYLYDDDSTFDPSVMMSRSSKSQRHLRKKPNNVFSSSSKRKKSSERPAESEDDSDCDYIFPAVSSVAVMQDQIERRNHDVLNEVAIDSLCDSLPSSSSCKPKRTTRKHCFRANASQGSRDDESSCLDDASCQSSIPKGMERTVDNLACLLSEGDDDESNVVEILKGLDRDVVLQRLHDVAPHLYKSVLSRLEKMYMIDTKHQQGTFISASITAENLKKKEAALAIIEETVGMHLHPGSLSSQIIAGITSGNADRPAATRPNSQSLNSEKNEKSRLLTKNKTKSDSPHTSRMEPDGRKCSREKDKPRISSRVGAILRRSVSVDGSHEIRNAERVNGYLARVQNPDYDDSEETPLGVGEDKKKWEQRPSTGADSNGMSSIATKKGYKIGSSRQGSARLFDETMKDSIASKIVRLNTSTTERKIVSTLMDDVLDQLERTSAHNSETYDSCMLLKSAQAAQPNLQSSMIRKIHKKRQAMAHARRRDQQDIHGSPQHHLNSLSGPSDRSSPQFCSDGESIESQHNFVPNSEVDERHDIEEEFKLEEFLTSPISHCQISSFSSQSSASISQTSEYTIRHMTLKRKMLRQALERSTISDKKEELQHTIASVFLTE